MLENICFFRGTSIVTNSKYLKISTDRNNIFWICRQYKSWAELSIMGRICTIERIKGIPSKLSTECDKTQKLSSMLNIAKGSSKKGQRDFNG